MTKKKEKIIKVGMIILLLSSVFWLGLIHYKAGYKKGKEEPPIFTYTYKVECIPQEFCEEIIDKYCSQKQREAQKEGERGYYGMDCLDWHLEQQFKQYWEEQNE